MSIGPTPALAALGDRGRQRGKVLDTAAIYREVLETAPDAVLVIDSTGAIVLANAKSHEVFGYSSDQLLGSPLELLVPGRLAKAHARHRRRFFAVPANRPMGSGVVLHGQRSDGTEFPAEVSLSSVETDTGRFVVAAIRDVSERVRISAALSEAEEKFRSTFQSATIGMALSSLAPGTENELVDANESLSLLSGYRRDELLGMNFVDLHDRRWQARALSGMKRLLLGEVANLRYECRIVDARGERAWVHVTSVLVRNDAGEALHCLHQVIDLRKRKQLEEDLKRLADHDTLTDLFNRRRFLAELEREARAARVNQRPGSVLLLDLDHFKYINDSQGHLAGDALIVRTAAVLRQRLRTTDTLARLGGDEFAAILPDTTDEEAQALVAGVLAGVRSELQPHDDEVARPLTASIGIAPFHLQEDTPITDLLSEADIAMYDAKEAGRDRFAFYTPSKQRQSQMNWHLNCAHVVRNALDNDAFLLQAQPIVSLNGTGGSRFELLLRLIDDNGELVYPGSFLGVANQFGLASDIDAWVARRAVQLLVDHGGSGQLSLAVNLSAHSLTDDRLLDLIAEEVANSGVSPNSLCFELTETAAIDNIENARRFADRLREIGCEFALDDFGNGYASFYYVKHLEFDYVKIDGEFIRGLLNSEKDQVIVRSVAQMARGLGKKTIAEFVEDAATLELLRENGIDYAQGFHVGKPAPVSVLADAVHDGRASAGS